MSALVLDAKRAKNGLSGVVIFGGGAPKNVLLQTEPQLQEILGVAEKGHDYFIQITDARPDTGGLSGATSLSEAVSWGRSIPDLPRHRGLLTPDSTIAMPLDRFVDVLARASAQAAPSLQAPERDGREALRADDTKSEARCYARYWPRQWDRSRLTAAGTVATGRPNLAWPRCPAQAAPLTTWRRYRCRLPRRYADRFPQDWVYKSTPCSTTSHRTGQRPAHPLRRTSRSASSGSGTSTSSTW
jgi:hypothetical protein